MKRPPGELTNELNGVFIEPGRGPQQGGQGCPPYISVGVVSLAAPLAASGLLSSVFRRLSPAPLYSVMLTPA